MKNKFQYINNKLFHLRDKGRVAFRIILKKNVCVLKDLRGKLMPSKTKGNYQKNIIS